MAFNLFRYNKMTAGALGAAATQLIAAFVPDLGAENVQIIGNALTVLLIYFVPNAAAEPAKPATP